MVGHGLPWLISKGKASLRKKFCLCASFSWITIKLTTEKHGDHFAAVIITLCLHHYKYVYLLSVSPGQGHVEGMSSGKQFQFLPDPWPPQETGHRVWPHGCCGLHHPISEESRPGGTKNVCLRCHLLSGWFTGKLYRWDQYMLGTIFWTNLMSSN